MHTGSRAAGGAPAVAAPICASSSKRVLIIGTVGGHKLWVLEQGAQGNGPARPRDPRVRTLFHACHELGDSRRSRSASTAVHPGFAEVRGDARPCLD